MTNPSTIQGEDMFRVDVAGLRRKFAHRSKNFLLYELYQNAVDEDVSRVSIELELLAGDERCRLVVEDDSPEGFKDLTHSYTLYADSTKMGDPEKRGIWNLGEKLVLAFCSRATIVSTKGTVIFSDGRRFHSDEQRERGTRFEGEIFLNREEYEGCCKGMRALIPPGDIEVTFNGQSLVAPKFAYEFVTTLPTTIGDESGEIRRTRRKTMVRLYDSGDATGGWIYEMGIPVVRSENRWHCDVQQRVPLNMMRDNVTPAYLQEIRVAVINAMYEKIDKKDVNQTWARAATNDKRCKPEATIRSLDLRFGKKRVSFDVRDREANKKAMDEGYTVVSGGSMSKQEWANAKEAEAIKPAGKVTPTMPAGKETAKKLEENEQSPAMQQVAAYVERIAPLLIEGRKVRVAWTSAPHWPVLATYANPGADWGLSSLEAELTFNVGRLGKSFFEDRSWEGLQAINELVIHELAHEYESDHLTRNFYDSMGLIGSRMLNLCLSRPELFADMVSEEAKNDGVEGFWGLHRVSCG